MHVLLALICKFIHQSIQCTQASVILKKWTEDDTPSSSLSHANVVETSCRSAPGGIWDLMWVFFVQEGTYRCWNFPVGCHFHHSQHICWVEWWYFVLPVEEFGNCLVHQACSASLCSSYIQLSKWIFWLPSLRTISFALLASRWLNGLIMSDTCHLTHGEWANTNYSAQHSESISFAAEGFFLDDDDEHYNCAKRFVKHKWDQ